MRLSADINAAWTRTPASVLFWLTITGYNLALGGALIAGSARRVSGPSFSSLRDYGGHVTWGAALLAVGALIAAAPLIGPRFLGAALSAAGGLHLLLAAGFIAAMRAPDAALTGALTYPFVAALHALHGLHYRRAARTP